MQKYIYKTDFSDLSQSLKDQLIDTIIEKKFYRGDYDNINFDDYYLDKEKGPKLNLSNAKENEQIREEIENELNVNIVIDY